MFPCGTLFSCVFDKIFIKVPYRQGNYCNNLATRIIPFFIVSKSSVHEIILKTVLPHFSKGPFDDFIIYSHHKKHFSKHA